jgi:hypothetical protein
MPKPKISLLEFIYRCKNSVFEDVLVEGLGYVFWMHKATAGIRITQSSRDRAKVIENWEWENCGVDTFFLEDKVAIVLPAYLDPDFESRRKESEDNLIKLFKKHFTDSFGNLDKTKYQKVEKDIREDMLSLAGENPIIPVDIKYSEEMTEYFNYHEGFNSQRMLSQNTKNISVSNESDFSSSEYLQMILAPIGFTLNSAGRNNVVTRGKFDGATSGTSSASKYFRNTAWGQKSIPKSLFNVLPKRISTPFGSTPIRTSTWGGLAGRMTPVLGRTFIVTGIGISVYNVGTAVNKPKAISKEAGGWVGALTGAKLGAMGGAGIGGIFGGFGAVPGSIAGGIAGGIAGFWGGSIAGEKIYELTE